MTGMRAVEVLGSAENGGLGERNEQLEKRCGAGAVLKAVIEKAVYRVVGWGECGA